MDRRGFLAAMLAGSSIDAAQVLAAAGSVGVWNNPPVYTILQGQSVNVAGWMVGGSGMSFTNSVFPGASMTNAGLLTMAANATPGLYIVTFTATSGTQSATTTNAVRFAVVESAAVVWRSSTTGSTTYSTFAAANTASAAGATITFTPGKQPSGVGIVLTKDITVQCTDPNSWLVLDANNTSHGVAAISSGDSPPAGGMTVTVKNIWGRNQKANISQQPGDGSIIKMDLSNVNIHWTIQDCRFDECGQPIFSARVNGNINIVDCEFVNNGLDANPSVHDIYVDGGNGGVEIGSNPIIRRVTVSGCKFYATYDHSMLPHNAAAGIDQRWRVNTGHYLKSRAPETYVLANYFKTVVPPPGVSWSSSAKINADEGGVVYIDGNIIEENRLSAYDPIDPSTASDTKICDYNFTGQWPVNELHMRQNTISYTPRLGTTANEKICQFRNAPSPPPPSLPHPYNPTGSARPPIVDIKDNVIGGPVADATGSNSDGTTYASTNQMGTLVQLFNDPNPVNDNYSLKNYVLGLNASASLQFTLPLGTIPRTDAYRGAVPPRMRQSADTASARE